MTSTLQYGRKLSVIVGDKTGQGLDFMQFRVTFEVRRGDVQTPNSADVRIYNLSEQTASRIANEFTTLIIQAGYEGNFGMIFRGTIRQVRKGREDAKNTYVDITAADGDEAYNYSTMAMSLAAGAKPADAVQAFIQAMAQAGIQQGYIPDMSTNGLPRGRVFYGMTRDELRDFARAHNILWSIQDGELTMVPQTAYVPGAVPVISPQSGLIGVPEQTQNGIEMTVLLNPLLRIGQRVRLDSSDVNQLRYGLDLQSQARNSFTQQRVKLDADGMYYVMQADHSGDTRGNTWYTKLTCIAIDVTDNVADPAKGAVQDY